VPRVSLGQNEPSILTPLLTLIWQLVSTVKTLSMVKVRSNGRAKEVARSEVGTYRY